METQAHIKISYTEKTSNYPHDSDGQYSEYLPAELYSLAPGYIHLLGIKANTILRVRMRKLRPLSRLTGRFGSRIYGGSNRQITTGGTALPISTEQRYRI